jgi:hypothetical protein
VFGNKRVAGVFFIFLLLMATFGYCESVKEPNVAGAFYPDDPKVLSAMIEEFLAQAKPSAMNGEIFALISPHAGYGYSGQVAAFGYKLIEGKSYKTVIVLAPSHQYAFSGVSVYAEGAFRTPLGEVLVDRDFTQKLLNKIKDVAYVPEAFAKEHAVEVQIPFLQKVLPFFKIVPIIMGDSSYETCQRLAILLKNAIGERKDILVVASTDLYHGYDFEEALRVDKETVSSVEKMDAEGLFKGLENGQLQMCGGYGVVTTLILSKLLGHEKTKVLCYTNSAEVTGKKEKGVWTVGYVSCAIDNDSEEASMLNIAQRKRLLEIARKTIETHLLTGKKMEVTEADPVFNKEMGAFVTLHKDGELRGCIGNIIGRGPLYLTVRDMAIEAATGDPRFSPVKPGELKNIEIEISVLTPLEKIDDVSKIKMGVHGVLVRKGYNSGVFLPQVATETGWSREEFLSNLCAHKAGLAADAWKDKSTDIYIFSAEVFSEKEVLSGD